MTRYTFQCLDGHTCGNPVRLVTSGHPDLKGETMAEKRLDFIKNHDWIRTSLMYEPKGSSIMSGAFLYPSGNPKCNAGILFIEVSGCLPMCGHGTIGAVTMAVENGLLTPDNKNCLCLETPAGVVDIEVGKADKKVTWVRIKNVPAYLAARNIQIDVAGLGPLTVNIAFGGNYYAIVHPQGPYPGLDTFKAQDILRFSPLVRDAVNKSIEIVHPEDPNIRGVSHVQWTDKPKTKEADARNAVFYGESGIDRSPCGTGTSARMAELFDDGTLKVGDTFIHESIIGTTFEGRVEEETMIAHAPAIRPSIKGWAYQTGKNIIWVNEDDPLAHGFQVH